VVFSTSCSLGIRKKVPTGPTAHPLSDIAIKPNQIRLRMRSLVEPFTGEIEQTADKVIEGTSDREVKRAAIQWKIEGVPAIRSTLFQPDPFTAVFDTWVLTYQMADYFQSGPGHTTLGSSASLAVDASLRLENKVTDVAASFTSSGDVSKVRSIAKQWAIDHPIRSAIRNRETALSRVTQRDAGVEWSTGEIIAEMAATADDLHREIQIYSDHLFRQARWEAELLKLDFPSESVLSLAERAVRSSERAATTLDQLTPSLATASSAAAKAADAASDASSRLPLDIAGFVTSERKAAVVDISQNLDQTLRFLQGERIAALRQVHDERIAAMEQIALERVAVLREVREIAETQRRAINKELEQSSMKVVDHASALVARIVAATLVAVFAVCVFLLFLARRLFLLPGTSRGIQRAA
jgi:hypothetical protein